MGVSPRIIIIVLVYRVVRMVIGIVNDVKRRQVTVYPIGSPHHLHRVQQLPPIDGLHVVRHVRVVVAHRLVMRVG
jgi:hypothetical protein